MSDFDREAERERLREKYERDQRKRESSERMSDLLLKGATMTNAHCDDCGDPVFRYEGEEFCPTCQEVVTGENAEAAAQGDDSGSADASGDATPASEGADQASATDGTPTDATANGTAAADGTPTDATANGTAAADGTPTQGGQPAGGDPDPAHIEIGPSGSGAEADGDAGTGASESAGASAAAGATASEGSGGSPGRRGDATAPRTADRGDASTSDGAAATADTGDGLAAARASLVRTLRTQAERAENCDDPRRAKDHLAAAREAAETLSALSSSY